MLAASSVTTEEKAAAQLKRADGSKSVVVEPTPYRPKLESVYLDPEVSFSEDDGLEFLYATNGKALLRPKVALPP